MERPEVQRFLRSQSTLILASNGLGGWPHLAPMWFVLLDGAIHTWTYGTSQKAKNLERDPRATILVEGGDTYRDLRGAMISSTAVTISDDERVYRVGLELGRRYAAKLPHKGEPEALESFTRDQAKRRVVHRFGLDYVRTWDHTKLEGRY